MWHQKQGGDCLEGQRTIVAWFKLHGLGEGLIRGEKLLRSLALQIFQALVYPLLRVLGRLGQRTPDPNRGDRQA